MIWEWNCNTKLKEKMKHVVSKVPELQEHPLLRNTLNVVGVEDENTDQQAQVADNNEDDKNSSSARRSSSGELNTDHTSHEEEKEKKS